MKTTTHALKAFAIASTFLLSACATKTQDSMSTAATTPLSDLNIVRADIPEVLEQARKQPYELPADRSCAAVAAQVRALDDVLGADLDAPATEATRSLVERGTEAVAKSAIGAVQRTAEGVVPFRSWVRKLSGAERYSKNVSSAIAAGTARRAFLKGVNAASGCASGAPSQVTAASR